MRNKSVMKANQNLILYHPQEKQLSSGSFGCKSVSFSMGSGGPDYYLSDQSDFEENEMYSEEIKTWTKADGDPTEEMMRRWKHKLVWM